MIAKISIIDYDVGNVRSIYNALSFLGAETYLTKNSQIIEASDAIILPGVGSFPHGMSNLRKSGLDKVIDAFSDTNKPILGICLGMQLLMEKSEEFETTEGLGLIEGSVEKLQVQPDESLPNIGWEEIYSPHSKRWDDSILEGVASLSDFFFCHSYAAVPKNNHDILCLSNYGNSTFCAAVQKNNVIGLQFHPEQSGKMGLYLLKKFVEFTCSKKIIQPSRTAFHKM